MDRSARRRREDCFHHYRSNLYVLLLFVIFLVYFFIFNDLRQTDYIVGFVAAAVSMPIGGCRASRPVVEVSVAAELAVL